MDSIAANPVSFRSENSRMDIHLPAGSAGPWMHWSSLSLLAPRPHPPSQNHHVAGHASGAGQAGIWLLVRGTGFPRPRLQTARTVIKKLMDLAAGQARPGVLQVCPAKKKFLHISWDLIRKVKQLTKEKQNGL
jgi:hypothetical protein|tara:strand:+ start:692 stop:1090 length:399 start_codon:yes stop_codon:yes gene_type:complete